MYITKNGDIFVKKYIMPKSVCLFLFLFVSAQVGFSLDKVKGNVPVNYLVSYTLVKSHPKKSISELWKKHKIPKVILPDAIQHLKSLPWTGNVRELRNVIERLVIMCGDEIMLDDVRLYASFGN